MRSSVSGVGEAWGKVSAKACRLCTIDNGARAILAKRAALTNFHCDFLAEFFMGHEECSSDAVTRFRAADISGAASSSEGQAR